MDIIDELNLDVLSSEFELYKPNLKNSVAGVLPEILKRLHGIDTKLLKNTVVNSTVGSAIDENYPSGYKNVFLLIADGVGAKHLTQIGGSLADNIQNQGRVVSSLFPTMTATIMTSLSYGLNPTSHGVVGYNIIHDNIGIWNALNLQYIQNNMQRSILDDIPLSELVNGSALIDLIKDKFNTTFISPHMPRPNLLNIIAPNQKIHEYETIEQAVTNAFKGLNSTTSDTGSLVALYYPLPDHYGHHYSPESPQYAEAIRGAEKIINAMLQHPSIKNQDTAVFLISDHGQSRIDHDISRWMDREQWNYHKNRGFLLGTSGRTIHLYTDKIDEGRELMEKLADDRGYVIDNKLAMELAGGDKKFTQRIAQFHMIMEENYIHDIPEIVPFEQETRLHGQHGSLTEKEIAVPFAIF